MYAVNSSCVMSIAKKQLKGQGSQKEDGGYMEYQKRKDLNQEREKLCIKSLWKNSGRRLEPESKGQQNMQRYINLFLKLVTSLREWGM